MSADLEPPPLPSSVVADQLLVHDLFIVALTILFYDYLVTLPAEVHFIWLRRKRGSSYWFIINRYLALSTTIIVTVLKFAGIPPHICSALPYVEKGFLVAQEIVIFVILVLRVYAMFNLDRRVLLLLSASCIAVFVISAWLVTTNRTSLPPGPMISSPGDADVPNHASGALPQFSASVMCPEVVFHSTAIRVAGAWEAQFALDALIFLLTVYRAFMHHRRGEWQSSLLSCLFRDGVIYFLVIAVANLANIIMYYYGDPLLSGCLTWFANSLSAVMIARLMLNLHAAAASGILTTGAGRARFDDENEYGDETGMSSDDTGTVVFVRVLDGNSGGRCGWPPRGRDKHGWNSSKSFE